MKYPLKIAAHPEGMGSEAVFGPLFYCLDNGLNVGCRMRAKTLTVVLLLFVIRALPAQDIPTIPLHISLISERHEVSQVFTDENINWITDTLNQEFKSGDSKQLLHFD